VGGADIGGFFQVGYGAGDLQNAVVGPGRQPQPVDGRFQQTTGGIIDAAVIFDEAATHAGVAKDFAAGKALGLNPAGIGHPTADGFGGFGLVVLHQVLIGHRRHLHMHVDTIQQGSGNFGAVAVDLLVGAAALVFGIG